MIKNKKGSILVITVISMFILTIIGFICLEMFVSQNILIATDVAKIKTFYAADGVVEMLRGYINANYPETGTNTFDLAVPASGVWALGSNYINNLFVSGYDDVTTRNPIFAKVELRRAPVPPNTLYVDFATTTASIQYYRIMGVSSVTVNSDVIYSTVSYYFYISNATPGGIYRKRFAGWREHKYIQNDNGTVQ